MKRRIFLSFVIVALFPDLNTQVELIHQILNLH